MNIIEKIDSIRKGEIESRYNSYIIFLENNSNYEEIEKLENINISILNIEDILESFFKETKLNLRVFDNSKFFKFLWKKLDELGNDILVVGLGVIENILYNKNINEDHIKKFFSELGTQVYEKKIFFLVENIKKMKIKNQLENSSFPTKNILYMENNF
ncbi:hypothetical protein [Cetobacterium sp. SF1]|uniref:hypothetical protein n=1 Tax=Cetobacterium sp. SF1 TaxID=3417654 RepID=UPI003CF7E9E7